MLLRRFAGIAVVAASMLAPASALADVDVAGTGEPAFTKPGPTNTNTQWYSYDVPGGSDGYKLEVTYFKDGVEVNQFTTPDLGLSGATNQWVNWNGIQTLEEGHAYEICIQGLFSLPNDSLYFDDGDDSCSDGAATGKRTETTIDLTKPTVSVELADGAASILGPSVPLEITYTDNLAPPFPANYLCQGVGADSTICDPPAIFGESAPCSVPAASTPSTTFNCTLDTSAVDTDTGEFFACVRAADSAVPDKPGTADQSGNADQANISDPACDSIDLQNAECEAAKAKAAKAKAKLRRLKQNGASDEKIAKAKKAARKAKKAAKKACA
ncbi:MAG: hypothetical protein QOI31_1573 [Solirubrobacterales bacterium]|jgi:hypothetical protein|nr:hypothetical protein [Solirubrobacterales bacterium]